MEPARAGGSPSQPVADALPQHVHIQTGEDTATIAPAEGPPSGFNRWSSPAPSLRINSVSPKRETEPTSRAELREAPEVEPLEDARTERCEVDSNSAAALAAANVTEVLSAAAAEPNVRDSRAQGRDGCTEVPSPVRRDTSSTSASARPPARASRVPTDAPATAATSADMIRPPALPVKRSSSDRAPGRARARDSPPAFMSPQQAGVGWGARTTAAWRASATAGPAFATTSSPSALAPRQVVGNMQRVGAVTSGGGSTVSPHLRAAPSITRSMTGGGRGASVSLARAVAGGLSLSAVPAPSPLAAAITVGPLTAGAADHAGTSRPPNRAAQAQRRRAGVGVGEGTSPLRKAGSGQGIGQWRLAGSGSVLPTLAHGIGTSTFAHEYTNVDLTATQVRARGPLDPAAASPSTSTARPSHAPEGRS